MAGVPVWVGLASAGLPLVGGDDCLVVPEEAEELQQLVKQEMEHAAEFSIVRRGGKRDPVA